MGLLKVMYFVNIMSSNKKIVTLFYLNLLFYSYLQKRRGSMHN